MTEEPKIPKGANSIYVVEEREKCPFNHTRMCPHGGAFRNNTAWCNVCVMVAILREITLIGARQQ